LPHDRSPAISISRQQAGAGGAVDLEKFHSRAPSHRLLNPSPMNRLLFGDNLKWLCDPKLFPDASEDLVYLAPPFNSNADYNVLFREASGEAMGRA